MRFVAKVVKYWYLYLIPLLVIPTAATIYGQHKATVYESTASLFASKPKFLANYTSTDDNIYYSSAQNLANSFTQLLGTESFITDVAKNTSLAATYDLTTSAGQNAAFARTTDNITVTATQTGQNIVTLTVDDVDAKVAQELGKSLIKQFVVTTAKRQVTLDTDVQAFFQQQLTDQNAVITKDIAAINTYVKLHPNPASADLTYSQLSKTLTDDQAKQQQLTDSISAVQTDLALAQSGQLVNFDVPDQPSLPTQPTVKTTKMLIYTIGSLLATLAVVGIAAGIHTRLDRKVYGPKDVRAIFDRLDWDAPPIEVMPMVGAKSRQRGGQARDADYESAMPQLLLPMLATLPRRQEPTRGELTPQSGVAYPTDDQS